MKSALIECIPRHLGRLELANVGVDLDSSLIDLGYDSFKFVELVQLRSRYRHQVRDLSAAPPIAWWIGRLAKELQCLGRLLVINIEARSDMEFPDEDLDYRRFDRVSDLLRYVEGRVAAPALGGASYSVAESIRHDEV